MEVTTLRYRTAKARLLKGWKYPQRQPSLWNWHCLPKRLPKRGVDDPLDGPIELRILPLLVFQVSYRSK